MNVPAPTAPPKLDALRMYRDRLEKERGRVFAEWKEALRTASGNISRAAEALFGDKRSRWYGQYLTRTFELREYAKALRVASGGQERGRPAGS